MGDATLQYLVGGKTDRILEALGIWEIRVDLSDEEWALSGPRLIDMVHGVLAEAIG